MAKASMTGGGQMVPEDVDLSSVTAGYMAGAGTVQMAARQSVVHGDVEFTCAAGDADCAVTVEVGADGTVTATSAGGMVTAMNSAAYNTRITPMAVDLAPVTAGFMAQAGTVTITAGQSAIHGDVEFTCAAGGDDCGVTVEVGADGTVSATSTGGMVTAMNSDAYNTRITPMAVNLSPVTAGFMAGAGTIQVAAGQSVNHGDVEFTCAAGGADCEVMVEVDANGSIAATSTGGMVTAMNAPGYPPPMPPAHPFDRGDPTYLANAIDLIADNGRQDDQGNYISAWTWANWGVGAQQAAANHTYREGSHANVIVFHDENEELQFNVAIVKNDTAPLLQENPVRVRAHQYLETEEIGQTLEGVTRFMRPVTDHDLGSGWQVAELTNDYDNGGTLTINIATDLEVADMSENPFAGPSQYGRSIILDDVPDIPAGKDFVVAWIDNGESITGTLDGVAGAFSCANPEGCSFFDDVQEGDFYPASEDVTFVPDDGSGDVPLPISFGVPVDTANYLAFGNWLYVPEDVTDMDAYDFGVFASGGDPFVAAYIEQQTDVFTYAGDATGVYYANESSPSPDIGSFSADVELIADFGTTSEFGTVTGELRNFAFAGEGSSVFPTTVALTKNIYDDFVTGFGVQQGQTNIFVGDNPYNALSQPGGWIEGLTSASTQAGSWWGRWGGKFYGRGLESLDIPPSYVEPPQSIGGVFGLYNGDNGLAGSFGAHRQDDQ